MKHSLGRYGFPLAQRESMLKSNIKDLGFLSSGFLFCNVTTVCAGIIKSCSSLTMGIAIWGITVNADVLAIADAVDFCL